MSFSIKMEITIRVFVPVQRVILIVERFFEPVASVTREKLEPLASLKAPRTLSFLLPMRRSAREKSLSASGFALRATTRQVAEGALSILGDELPGNMC